MKTLPVIAVALVLTGCASRPDTSVPAAPSVRHEKQPEIAGATDRLDAPSSRISGVNAELRERVALLESERATLKREASKWEDEMARWTDRGLTAEQQLELALEELAKVRANWFTQLDAATTALRAQVEDLTAAHDLLELEKERLKKEAVAKDMEVARLYGDKAADAASISRLNRKVDDLADVLANKDREVAVKDFLLKISLVLAIYVVLRILKYTPWGRGFLFWLP